MSMLPFFAFFLLVFLGHFFAYKLIIIAWPGIFKKTWLVGLMLAAVTLLFFASFISLNIWPYSFIAYLYVLAAILFALLTQLMLFAFIFCLRLLLLKYWPWFKRNCLLPDPKSTARLFFFLAIVFFLLGTYNAFFPKVKTITLDAFSPETKDVQFVHLSDLHLGAVYRPFYLSNLVRRVNALRPDFVIISGDLFDGSDKGLEEFISPLSVFEMPVIFVPGNHDTYLTDMAVNETVKAAGFIHLVDEAILQSNLEIIAFNYLSNQDSNLNRTINNLDADQAYPRIVVNHVPVDHKEANDLGAKLFLSGHAHRGQIFPFSLVTSLIYGPFAYGLEQYENMITYTSAGTATWGPPIRTIFPGEIILFSFK
ncbi:MAG: metallophosphoesterase, partial [Patescibacteria group bacterium]|jgi:predicted MPP superfamily phosphohydrolase|nr:metallophosphoesterase [Patescibacteria group bacterium]